MREAVEFMGQALDLVEIDNLDLLGVGAGPTEADAPLVVNSNRVLATAIPLERFQSIAGWQLKEGQLDGGINQLQLDQRSLPDVTRKVAGAPGKPQLFGVAVRSCGGLG